MLAQIAERRPPPFPEVPTPRGAGFDVPAYAVVCGVAAPPGMPLEALASWEDFFARLVKTSSWRKCLADSLFEDGFQRGAELAKLMAEFREQVRGILMDVGAKVVR